jgi:hypothetical protein
VAASEPAGHPGIRHKSVRGMLADQGGSPMRHIVTLAAGPAGRLALTPLLCPAVAKSEPGLKT